MISVIQTGGKQYLVKTGDIVSIEKREGESGKPVTFDAVLLTASDDSANVEIGAPTVNGATVLGTIVEQGRSDKIRVTKFKRKVRYRRIHGHRQHYTKVAIA